MKRACIGYSLGMVFVATTMWGQTQGRVAGKIVDVAGNPLPGATIAVEDLSTSATYDGVSNKKGRFTVGVVNGSVPHQVIISLAGFQSLSNEITIGSGQTFQQVFTMIPEGSATASSGGGAQRLEGGSPAIRLYNKGAELYNEGDKLAARKKMTQALVEAPDLADAKKILASIALERGEYAEALENAANFLLERPNDAVGLTLMFDILFALGRYVDAAALVPALAAGQPTLDTAARAYNNAVQLFQGEDLETAGVSLESALVIDPSLMTARLLLAEVRQQQGDYVEAIALASQVFDQEPGNVSSLAILHRAYVKTGDSENASKVFGLLADADPSSVAITFTEEGARLFREGQTEAAVEVLEQAVTLDPDNAEANFHLGVAYVGEGKTGEAKKLLARFLELSPDHPEAGNAEAMLGYLQ